MSLKFPFQSKAEQYKAEAEEGMKEDADGDGSTVAAETKADFTDIAKEPVAYTQTGEVINLTEQKTNISLSL